MQRALTLALLALLVPAACAVSEEPVRLIFDTDMGNDCDDALALGVIHALQSRGVCKLLAVTITKDNELAAPFVDAVNTFYGRGEIPIGVVRGGVTPETGRYLELAKKEDNGALRYPHDLSSGKDAPEATSLLRKVLAAQPDASVVIAQVGFASNLARLLESKPDEFSPLGGRALAARKVKFVSAMFGAFAPIPGKSHHLEYNVVKDLPASHEFVKNWPTPIVFSGFEIGIAVRYPAATIARDYAYTEHHILAESYALYNPDGREQPLWDLTSVLYAVFPERDYIDLSPAGKVTVEEDAFTRFEEEANGQHRFLIASPAQVRQVREALVQLSSQPSSATMQR